MKNKTASQGVHGQKLNIPRRESAKSTKTIPKKLSPKLLKTTPKKVSTKRTSVKLRTSSEKNVAKRTRNKSTKVPSAYPKHVGKSAPTEKASSGSGKTVTPGKSKNPTQHVKLADRSINKNSKMKNSGITKTKGNVKKKIVKQLNTNDFFDLWAFVSFGKREASLNASMKVNILFEKHSASKVPPRETQTTYQCSQQSESMNGRTTSRGKITVESTTNKMCKGESFKEPSCHKAKESDASKEKSNLGSQKLSKKTVGKKTMSASEQVYTGSRKRKSPSHFHDECSRKIARMNTKLAIKLKKKPAKRNKKSIPPGHQLCNIIEKAPRQASLIAKAMIAMEQEEETGSDSAARTEIYDWTELRSYTQSQPRRIQWWSGKGKTGKESNEKLPAAKGDEVGAHDIDNTIGTAHHTGDSEYLHNTVLRTLHQIGNARILNEYLRAQKEDFRGSIDVELCTTPEKHVSPDPKLQILPHSVDDKLEKVPEKPASCSPIKPQPCRVATPIPHFPAGHRTGNITSFIQSPMTQPAYPQQHVRTHSQPIKVTPYPPNPAYVYQYPVEHTQREMYSPTSPSPIPYGVGNNEVSHRGFPSTFTVGGMGGLCLQRSGINPYQSTTYGTSLHMPMQQIGFNYGSYYPTPIQAIQQQPMQALQTLAIPQQYPLVSAPVITQHHLPQDVGQCGSYQHGCPQYSTLPGLRQNERCMPPPPPPPAHRPTPLKPLAPLRPPPVSVKSAPSISPMGSQRPPNSAGFKPVIKSPGLDFTQKFINQGNPQKHQTLLSHHPHCQQQISQPNKGTSNQVMKYSVACSGQDKSFSACKREQEELPVVNCDLLNKISVYNNECPQKSPATSRANCEDSNVSDLLHSAHSAMYQIDGVNCMENIRELQQVQASVSCDSSMRNCSPSKISIIGHASFSASYSVSSILDMPSCKIKAEPNNQNIAVSKTSNSLNFGDPEFVQQSFPGHSAVVCFASAGSSGGPEETGPPSRNTHTPQKSEFSHSRDGFKVIHGERKSGNSHTKNIIVIEDTDESSDDEPLSKLVRSRTCEGYESQLPEGPSKGESSNNPKKSDFDIPSQVKNKAKQKSKPDEAASDMIKFSPDGSKVKKTISSKSAVCVKNNPPKSHCDVTSRENATKPLFAGDDDQSSEREMKKSAAKKTTLANSPKTSLANSPKTSIANSPKSKKPGKKTKTQPLSPQTNNGASASHGWSWVGEGELKPIPKLIPGKEEPVRIRKCFKSMQHSSGEIVSVRDCVILQADGDGKIPYVAKVSALWENLNGEMMFSLLWYYQPEHTVAGREPEDGDQELFASKHREENSVACIDDKCYVLMYNEYCRLEAENARVEQGIAMPRWREQVAEMFGDDKKYRRCPPPTSTCAENIWFCRYDYDARKKLVKKPKHRKCNLRYRAPCKMI